MPNRRQQLDCALLFLPSTTFESHFVILGILCLLLPLTDCSIALVKVNMLRMSISAIKVNALLQNEIRIVQASLLGSILANLLLILGMCFLFGGLRFREQVSSWTRYAR